METPQQRPTTDIWTAAALGALAYIADDITHEVLGHGLAACFVPGILPVSLSTVGLSTEGTSQLVALAGPMLNVLVGCVALGIFQRRKSLGLAGCFLWLFGTLNLFNGFGYGLFSGLLDFGDLAVVISGLKPHFFYRGLIIAVGAIGYGLTLRHASRMLADRINELGVPSSEVVRLTLPAYVTGGALFLLGSMLNPIPSLVLLSGLSSGFACMAGLLWIPALVKARASDFGNVVAIERSWPLILGGVVCASLFVGVLGPGISL